MALRSWVPNYSQHIDTIGFDISGSACNGAPTDAAGIRTVLRNLYVAIDTTVGGVQDSLSLFDPEFAARNNYSVDFTYTGADFPVCNRGRKYQVITSVFDWCEGGIEKDTVILKFEDRTAPQFSVKNTAANGGAILGQYASNPATISVNTNDCSASLRLPEKSESGRLSGFERDLGTLFNWTVSDVCVGTAVRLNYRFQTSKEYNNGYFIDRADFVDRNYTVANMNGGPVALGLPVGFHRIIIEAWDGCSVENTDTLWFNVNDQVAPIMKCDDQLNITLTSNSTSNYYVSNKEKELDQYARLYVSDINEGSRDNCTLDSMFVRRKVSAATITNYLSWNRDYDTYSASGSSNGTVGVEDFEQIGSTTMYYTPKHMQYVEFYCTDGGVYNSQLSESPMVELWGSDVNQPIFYATGDNIFTSNPTTGGTTGYNRNWSYCWATINIEDKTPPVINAPDLTKEYNTSTTYKGQTRAVRNWVPCTDKEIIGTSIADGDIASETISNSLFGKPDIYGIECNGSVSYSVRKKLTCDTGVILRIWEVNKTIKTNPLTTITVRDTQVIYVQASHNYAISVPRDENQTCFNASEITTKPEWDEDGCDLLAMSSVTQRVYDATEPTDNACKKVYRTWTVINWCQVPNQLSCENADPISWARVIPRLKAVNTPADVNGDAVAITHRFTKSASTARIKSGGTSLSPKLAWIDGRSTHVNWPTNARTGTTSISQTLGKNYDGTSTAADPTSYALSNPNVACSGSVENERTFAWQYTQIIKVTDNTKPTIDLIAGQNKKFTSEDDGNTDEVVYDSLLNVFGLRGNDRNVTNVNECKALVEFSFVVSDGCPLSGPFTVDNARIVDNVAGGSNVVVQGYSNVKISPVDPGTSQGLGAGNNRFAIGSTITGLAADQVNLTSGRYQLVVDVRDDCGNLSTERIDFETRDIKAPSPICVQLLSVVLMPDNNGGPNNAGMVRVRATDLLQDVNRTFEDDECGGLLLLQYEESPLMQL